MEEFRVSGIVISSIDYKEKDKLVTLFTLELGKITAVLRGVKSGNAKLKFASQLFCFANFILVKSGEYYTITNADQVDSFYDLTANYNRFLVGQIILESIQAVMPQGEFGESLFIHTLKALRALAYEQLANEHAVLVKFLLLLFSINGYDLNFNECNECKTKLISDIYFNFELGFITCKNCAGNYNFQLSKKTYNYLKIINNASIEQLTTIKVNNQDLLDAIMVLGKNFENKFNKKLKTLNSLLI